MLMSLATGALACGDDADPATTPDDVEAPVSSLSLVVDAAPASAPAGEELILTFTLTVPKTDGSGGVAGTLVDVNQLTGGGSAVVEATDDAGKGRVVWTLGVVPVPQHIELAYGAAKQSVTVTAERTEPMSSVAFGEVVGFLDGVQGSTEDLVFADDRWILGAPEGLISVASDGSVQRVELTGEPMDKGWGVARDAAGILWVVDSGKQHLVRIENGVVTVVMAEAEGSPFTGMNDVEVGPDGKVYVSDPCTARIVRFDPLTGAPDAVVTFDAATQGGPNGMTWDAAGRLYTTTENTAVLCNQFGIAEIGAQLAHVFRLENTDEGFGPPEKIADALGVFGDGMTFDNEGNLYAITDAVDGLTIEESTVWVLPGGDGPAQKLLVAPGVLYANLGFGQGDFGDTTLYLCLLAIPPLTPDDSLGLHRVELGIKGATWLN